MHVMDTHTTTQCNKPICPIIEVIKEEGTTTNPLAEKKETPPPRPKCSTQFRFTILISKIVAEMSIKTSHETGSAKFAPHKLKHFLEPPMHKPSKEPDKNSLLWINQQNKCGVIFLP